MALLDKYPFDMAALSKGDLIDLPTLEQISGKTRGTEAFQFAVLAIQDRINSRTSMTAKICIDGLRILTDQEASEYNHTQFRHNVARTIRRHAKTQQVEPSNLSPDDQRRHEARLIGQSKVVQAIVIASRTVKIGKADAPAQEAPSATGRTHYIEPKCKS